MTECRANFRSYGVNFSIISNDEETLRLASDVAKSAMLGQVEDIESIDNCHEMRLFKVKGGIHFAVDSDDHGVSPWQRMVHFFDTCVRILIAEYADDRVFLHCGVVVWKGKTILFPGDSFTGKTTLVADFVRRGATYYSDEYAVLDKDGLVYPFARPLSLRHRTDLSLRFDTPAEDLGGKVGTKPVRVDFVFLLNFKNYARFRTESLSAGEAVLQILPQAISLRFKPEFTLNVLNKLSQRANVFSGQRGNSNIAVNKIVELIDKL